MIAIFVLAKVEFSIVGIGVRFGTFSCQALFRAVDDADDGCGAVCHSSGIDGGGEICDVEVVGGDPKVS